MGFADSESHRRSGLLLAADEPRHISTQPETGSAACGEVRQAATSAERTHRGGSHLNKQSE